MKLEEIEAKLIAACDQAIANGWKIKQRCTVDSVSGHCCALGASFAIGKYDRTQYGLYGLALTEYEMDRDEAGMFIDGFDAGFPSINNPHYEMGRRLRMRYVK